MAIVKQGNKYTIKGKHGSVSLYAASLRDALALYDVLMMPRYVWLEWKKW